MLTMQSVYFTVTVAPIIEGTWYGTFINFLLCVIAGREEQRCFHTGLDQRTVQADQQEFLQGLVYNMFPYAKNRQDAKILYTIKKKQLQDQTSFKGSMQTSFKGRVQNFPFVKY